MYKAPLKELRFAIHQLIGDERLVGLSDLPDYSTEFADAVLDEAARFAEGVLDPINRIGDRTGAKWTAEGVRMPAEFKAAYAKFVEGGWTQLRAEAEFGGQGAPTLLGTAVEELWASSNLAFKLCPMLTQGAVEAINQCGSQAQKEKYLPKMISGEWTGTMNLTEPQAGSDLAAIRTRAVKEGDHYRLYGQKIFITYGDHDYTSNIIHMVLGRVEGAPAGVRGISLFIVPKVLVNDDGSLGKPNDVRCVSIEHKLGIHGSPTCVLSYGDKEGAVAYLVGEENRGLEYMFIMMNAARLSVGLEGYALAERAYQQALEYSRTRVQGKPKTKNVPDGSKVPPIAYHPDVKRMLLTQKAYTDAARAVALYAAMQLDLGKHLPDGDEKAKAQARGELLIPIVKGWSTELGVSMASLGVQVHGGMGFIEETGAAQILRDSRIAPIYEGTTGIQAGDLVGRKVGRDNGAAMNALIADMQAELEKISSSDAGVAASKAAALEGVAALKDATAAVLKDPEGALAVCVPYLMLGGVVVGGWLTAKAHELAVRQASTDPDFFAAKQQISRFYAANLLPEAQTLSRVVKQGAASILDADPAKL
ncbi:acyl-CoA dehydrogenase [Steroidobacter agaridevorans]|uniref:3-methylmercaptopropionyl-CoA dehydrogenase n=1 Tax=Steroidobacter agaridevorans TaxID=2695856 RepID=A0A829YLN5_9GAMM|nr:acyl-CoA dehydrogenase [Steroidobacter agaridevorans]GFE83791.1 acyl-CoA dehydrogenase [Steroidobacter agaridevorans]